MSPPDEKKEEKISITAKLTNSLFHWKPQYLKKIQGDHTTNNIILNSASVTSFSNSTIKSQS